MVWREGVFVAVVVKGPLGREQWLKFRLYDFFISAKKSHSLTCQQKSHERREKVWLGKQRYQTGRAVVLLLRHGDKDSIVRDNVLRMLCSSRLFLPICRDIYDSFDHPLTFCHSAAGSISNWQDLLFQLHFPVPPFPIGRIRGEKGEDQVSYSPSPLAFLFILRSFSSLSA